MQAAMRLAIDIATTAAMGVAIKVPDRTHWYCATAALRSRRMISPPGVAERVGAVYRCSCDLRYPIAAIRLFRIQPAATETRPRLFSMGTGAFESGARTCASAQGAGHTVYVIRYA